MTTALTLQHGNAQSLEMSPSRLHIPPVVSISQELIGVLASTMPTFPLNFALLTPDMACFSFFPSQLAFYFGFSTSFEDLLDRLQCGLFGLSLDFFDDFFALFPLSGLDGNVSTHSVLKAPLWCSSFGLNYFTTSGFFSLHFVLFFLLHSSLDLLLSLSKFHP